MNADTAVCSHGAARAANPWPTPRRRHHRGAVEEPREHHVHADSSARSYSDAMPGIVAEILGAAPRFEQRPVSSKSVRSRCTEHRTGCADHLRHRHDAAVEVVDAVSGRPVREIARTLRRRRGQVHQPSAVSWSAIGSSTACTDAWSNRHTTITSAASTASPRSSPRVRRRRRGAGLAGAAVPDGDGMAGADEPRARGPNPSRPDPRKLAWLCGCHVTIVEETRSFRQVPTKKCDTYQIVSNGAARRCE